MKKKMTIRIIMGIVAVIIIAAIIVLRPSSWSDSGGENSVVPGNVTLGHISKEYLDDVKSWKDQGSAQNTFELADEKRQEGDTMTTINLIINNQVLTAKLADNTSAEALLELLKDGPLTISMRDYANMEKVGSLGTSLPANDEQITTEAGDLILYMGSAFVIYYAPNSWNFTRLGKIQNVSADELKQILGDGDVTVKLYL